MINLDDRILSKITPNELFLLLQIVKRMRINKMVSWPSIELLARECDWDERTVKVWRLKLIEKGYISIETRPGKPTLYRLTGTGISVYHSVDSDQGLQEEIEGGTKNEGVQKMHQKGVQKMRGKGVQKMYPELVNKELVNNVKGVNDANTPAHENSETLKAEFPQSPKVAPKGSFPNGPAQFPAATPEAWQDMGGVIKVVDPELPGVLIVDGAGPIEPPKELRYSDYPMPADAIELKDALSAYFEQRPQEWQKLIETAQVRLAKEKVADTVIEFCLYQQKESNLKRTFREYQAALTIWFRRQKSFDSQRTQNNNATTTAQKSTINRLGSDKSLYDEPALF